MKEFDKLWNYRDPAATEVKFREVIPQYTAESDLSGYLQLLTQIARTYSLRCNFDEAHKLLDEVEKQLPSKPDVAHIRYNLERGRTYNFVNWGKIPEAKPYFENAKQLAEQLGEDSYTIDAIHMLAITEEQNPDKAVKLNEEAVLQAEKSQQPEAKNWLGTLYNNLGWSYFDRGEYEKALSIFLRALQYFEEKKTVYQTFVAKWTIARALRALNRIDEAVIIQLALLEEMVSGEKPDGYVYEELAELHLLKNNPVNKMYFQFAYNELSKDNWLVKKEPARIERLLQLSK